MKKTTKVLIGGLALAAAGVIGTEVYQDSKKKDRIENIKTQSNNKKLQKQYDNALLDAANRYNVDDMSEALKNKANINAVDKNGYSSLMHVLSLPSLETIAARKQMMDCLHLLMNNPDIKFNIETPNGTTPISLLEDRINDYKEISKLIRNKNYDKEDGVYGVSEGLKILEEYKKSIEQKTNQEKLDNVLLDASYNHDIKKMKDAYKKGANPNATDENGYTVLMNALDVNSDLIAYQQERTKNRECIEFLTNLKETRYDIVAPDGSSAILIAQNKIQEIKDEIIPITNTETDKNLGKHGVSGFIDFLETTCHVMQEKSGKDLQGENTNPEKGSTLSWQDAKKIAVESAVAQAYKDAKAKQ